MSYCSVNISPCSFLTLTILIPAIILPIKRLESCTNTMTVKWKEVVQIKD